MEKPENLKIIVVGGTTYETRFTKKFERRVPYSPPDPRHVLCVIPGVVRALFVKPGSMVHAHDRLMVIEAMKMETTSLPTGTGSSGISRLPSETSWRGGGPLWISSRNDRGRMNDRKRGTAGDRLVRPAC